MVRAQSTGIHPWETMLLSAGQFQVELVVCVCVYVCVIHSQSCPTLCDPMDWSPPGSLSMGFSRQEYWSGVPFPSPGDFPKPGVGRMPPALTGRFFVTLPPGKWSRWWVAQNHGLASYIKVWSLLLQAPKVSVCNGAPCSSPASVHL